MGPLVWALTFYNAVILGFFWFRTTGGPGTTGSTWDKGLEPQQFMRKLMQKHNRVHERTALVFGPPQEIDIIFVKGIEILVDNCNHVHNRNSKSNDNNT